MAAQIVDFKNVSTKGLEKSAHPEAQAGLRANEARYFKNHYDADFEVVGPREGKAIIDRVNAALKERDIKFAAKPLQAAELLVDGVRWSYVFYDDGLAVNLLYTLKAGGKRAVGFKLCLGMDVPAELEGKFKFARMKSKLAGEIRGSFFVVKGEIN
ncbi:MAG: phage tail protein [Rhodoluna sp.]